MGFHVDALIEAARSGAAEPRQDALRDKAIAVYEADTEWLVVDMRWFCAWDSTPDQTTCRQLTVSPPLELMMQRCQSPVDVPSVCEPSLPAQLPKIPGRAMQKMRWPDVPTSRLGIAVLLKSGREIGDVDLIC
eukprot:4468471-Amphidinium_carterae.1